MKIRIAHLYPRLMNLYGDRGNIMVLGKRAKWRGIEPEICPVRKGEQFTLQDCDLIFIGGGQDREQLIIHDDLQQRRPTLLEAINSDRVVLAICGAFQLLGQYYETAAGEKIAGLELLSLYTTNGGKRAIGNIITALDPDAASSLAGERLVGFENHGGETFLTGDLKPLGRVVSGHGNNRSDDGEGCRYRNVFGTYLHGPLLPRNPHFADYLLRLALEQRYGNVHLKPLDDELEQKAHRKALQVTRQKNSQSEHKSPLRRLISRLWS